jgi:plasmid stability protein
MANLTVKDLPDALYEKLKSRAHANRRSIASEVTVLLERALGERTTSEEDLLDRAKRLRDRTPIRLTEEKRREALRRGASPEGYDIDKLQEPSLRQSSIFSAV